jgi:hypothetical protein
MPPVLLLLYVQPTLVVWHWLLVEHCWLLVLHLVWFQQVLLQEQPQVLRSTAQVKSCPLGLLRQQELLLLTLLWFLLWAQ